MIGHTTTKPADPERRSAGTGDETVARQLFDVGERCLPDVAVRGDRSRAVTPSAGIHPLPLAPARHQDLTGGVSLRMDRHRFADRTDAGRSVAALLTRYAGRGDVVVLGLPRGGVPVAAQVARGLGAELDVLMVRKLGVPGHQELAMGAIADVGQAVEVVTNDAVIARLGISAVEFDAVYQQELSELHRRSATYRGSRPPLNLDGRVVIIVDDGLATGATMRAAAAAVRRQLPARLIVAVPVGARATCDFLRRDVDEVVCARNPEPFRAVHQGYLDFTQTSDAEVLALLAERPASGG